MPIRSKTFEKLLLKQLMPGILSRPPIWVQSEKYSTTEHVQHKVTKIISRRIACVKKYYTRALLDIQQAFGSVRHQDPLSARRMLSAKYIIPFAEIFQN